ncbi:MAG: protein phosphatase 2C domain-containing protein [Treponema sp.]|jgi:serine/threonine protein phosphatase PrpC|nr:protein phosphatase 2C domain-containing protein [Treponema sp.]
MPYKGFSVTETGISHTKHGKGCEDFSLHYPPNDGKIKSLVSLAIVADGHGDDNCFRSAKGAEFAAIATKDAVIEFVDQLRPGLLQRMQKKEWFSKEMLEKYIHDLVKHIIAVWHGKAEDDYTNNPFADTDLANVADKYRKRYSEGKDLHHIYGTTLIVAAITKDYWFGIHIGDGRFTALCPDGSFAQPVPWDDRCYLNVTTSICDDDAAETARIYYALASEGLPIAVFLCSDGVDDNYPIEGNEQHLYRLYRTIALTFVEDGFDSTCGQIKDLANSFATKGKGDDTSIVGIIDMEAVKWIAPVLQKQVDNEKAEAEKAADKKAEAERLEAAKIEAEKVKEIKKAGTEKAATKTPEPDAVKRPPAGTNPAEADTAGNVKSQNKPDSDGIESYGSFEPCGKIDIII